jgi:hypothetical protein
VYKLCIAFFYTKKPFFVEYDYPSDIRCIYNSFEKRKAACPGIKAACPSGKTTWTSNCTLPAQVVTTLLLGPLGPLAQVAKAVQSGPCCFPDGQEVESTARSIFSLPTRESVAPLPLLRIQDIFEHVSHV